MGEEIWLQQVMIPLTLVPSKRQFQFFQICDSENLMMCVEESRSNKVDEVEILNETRSRALIMQCLMV
jgi:hypothetical protein